MKHDMDPNSNINYRRKIGPMYSGMQCLSLLQIKKILLPKVFFCFFGEQTFGTKLNKVLKLHVSVFSSVGRFLSMNVRIP